MLKNTNKLGRDLWLSSIWLGNRLLQKKSLKLRYLSHKMWHQESRVSWRRAKDKITNERIFPWKKELKLKTIKRQSVEESVTPHRDGTTYKILPDWLSEFKQTHQIIDLQTGIHHLLSVSSFLSLGPSDKNKVHLTSLLCVCWSEKADFISAQCVSASARVCLSVQRRHWQR